MYKVYTKFCIYSTFDNHQRQSPYLVRVSVLKLCVVGEDMQNLNILQQLIYCLIDCLQAKRFPLHCSICQLPCTALEKQAVLWSLIRTGLALFRWKLKELVHRYQRFGHSFGLEGFFMFFVFKQNSNCGDTFILKVWNFKVKQFVGDFRNCEKLFL